ncbi:MAG: CRISPR-associated helicase Cas3', partial [Paracoccaceae bacterium]
MSDLLAWPGKSPPETGSVEHPAIYHMLDVAAVAEYLIAPFGFDMQRRDALVLLIALHDLGKINEAFRRMLRGEAAGGGYRHWEVSEVLLRHQDDLLAAHLGSEPHRRAALYAAVAGHHGRPPDLGFPPSRMAARSFGEMDEVLKLAGAGVAASREVIAAFAALWPEASLEGLSLEESQTLGWWLAGLTTTADWVGSNTDWFAPCATPMPLDEYLAGARVAAQQAVQQAGLGGAVLRDGALFDFALRPMQAACAQVPLAEGPMLAVIEDETGAGKTEAALLLARRMLAAGKGRGLFVALPTMATADAMFARAAKVVGRMFDAPRVTLAHGRAGLSQEFRDIQQSPAQSPDDVTCTGWLAQSRRRALLADVGVGTIDQALLAVLPVKFQVLRYFGLSSKILIVDEVHELGEPYIGAELEALLRMHRAAGGSAILLTATLPLAQRARLLAVYGGVAQSRAYPALTVAGGAAVEDFPQTTGAKGPVRVTRLGAASDAVALIAGAAAQGAACVWVRNSVDDAIAAVQMLQAAGVAADLLHARFALTDRKRIEAMARARFGKDGQGRAGRVLVGTQVLESSLDFDFDVMVSDLAPMAALVQRAGRLWRHMAERPRATRPVPAPVLHVLSPDPAQVDDDRWLQGVLGGGAHVYPIADQWRTADHLFALGEITAPSGLRGLIEAVHGETARAVPPPLELREIEAAGAGMAARGHAAQNIVDFAAGYRLGGRGDDDASYPTRLGEEQQVLVLACHGQGGLRPWAEEAEEGWALSEVSASRKRLARFDLPDQSAPEIAAVTRDWPDWKRAALRICPVAE